MSAPKRPSPAYPREVRTLGEHLRKRRLDLGLDQWDVAKRIGVDVSTIQNWELGQAVPAVRSVPKILEFIGHPGPLEDDPARGFGDRLRRARLRLGLTQSELARQLSVEQTTISDWELDRHPATPKNREQIEALLACLLDPSAWS